MDNVCNKLYAFILFYCIAVSSGLPLPISMALLRKTLISTHTAHTDVYEDIKMKRFSNPDKVLPEQFINGMEKIKANLIILDEIEITNPAMLYSMHYESLSIFREAFFQMAVKEQTIEDYNSVLDIDLRKPTFHSEVAVVKNGIDETLKHMRQIMHHTGIEIPNFETPTIVLPHEVDGRLCEGYCDLERHLYIHQQFNYYLIRTIHSVTLIEEEI